MLQSAKELLSHIETIKALRGRSAHWQELDFLCARLIREKASQDLLQLLELWGVRSSGW